MLVNKKKIARREGMAYQNPSNINHSFILSLIKQDLKLALRKGGGVGNMLAFYLMVSSLFVFGIGADPKNTTMFAPAVIWICALLVQIFSLSRIFADDYEDGTLEQLILLGDLPEKIVIARMFSNWLSGGFLVMLFSPVIAILFGLDWHLVGMLLLSLMCGTPLLSIISVTAAALTLGIRKAEVIFGMLVFPLYVPVLIFGASWIVAQESFNANMGLMLAMFLFMLPLGVVASVASIKAALGD
jgi:heme exporter protein B